MRDTGIRSRAVPRASQRLRNAFVVYGRSVRCCVAPGNGAAPSDGARAGDTCRAPCLLERAFTGFTAIAPPDWKKHQSRSRGHLLPYSGAEQTIYLAAKRQGKGVTMSPEVVPFARSAQGERDDNSQLDKTGQTILQLLS